MLWEESTMGLKERTGGELDFFTAGAEGTKELIGAGSFDYVKGQRRCHTETGGLAFVWRLWEAKGDKRFPRGCCLEKGLPPLASFGYMDPYNKDEHGHGSVNRRLHHSKSYSIHFKTGRE